MIFLVNHSQQSDSFRLVWTFSVVYVSPVSFELGRKSNLDGDLPSYADRRKRFASAKPLQWPAFVSTSPTGLPQMFLLPQSLVEMATSFLRSHLTHIYQEHAAAFLGAEVGRTLVPDTTLVSIRNGSYRVEPPASLRRASLYHTRISCDADLGDNNISHTSSAAAHISCCWSVLKASSSDAAGVSQSNGNLLGIDILGSCAMQYEHIEPPGEARVPKRLSPGPRQPPCDLPCAKDTPPGAPIMLPPHPHPLRPQGHKATPSRI